MKKITLIIAAIIMAFTVCALSETAQMPSPITEYDSLEALNEACGTVLCGPGVMGVTDESYVSIECGEYVIAQYKFTVAGYSCCLRCAPTLEDISGYWLEETTAFDHSDDEDGSDMYYVYTADAKLAQWFNIDGQFVLQIDDNGAMDPETFDSVVTELANLNTSFVTAAEREAISAALAGSYTDLTGNCSSMEIIFNEDASLSITVDRVESDSTYTEWKMTAVMVEDLSICYSDCVCNLCTADENGVTELPANLIPDGFFVLGDDGCLYWTGAADPDCTECVFEKIAE